MMVSYNFQHDLVHAFSNMLHENCHMLELGFYFYGNFL